MRNPLPKQFNTRMLIGKKISVRVNDDLVYLGTMLEYFETTNSLVIKDFKVLEKDENEWKVVSNGSVAVLRKWNVIEVK